MRVLLVEDNVLLAFPVEGALMEAGHHVEVVHSGNDALSMLHREASLLDALVTDIRLGSGPDGWEVARRARKLRPQIRVAYMTGYSDASWEKNGVPGSLMLHKPYSLDELVKWLDMAP